MFFNKPNSDDNTLKQLTKVDKIDENKFDITLLQYI